MSETPGAQMALFLRGRMPRIHLHPELPDLMIHSYPVSLSVYGETHDELRAFFRACLTAIDGDAAADMARGDLDALDEAKFGPPDPTDAVMGAWFAAKQSPPPASPDLQSPGEGSPHTADLTAAQGEPLGATR